MVQAYLTHFQNFSKNVKIFLLGNALQSVGLSIYGLLFNLYLKELGYGESVIGGLISTTSLGISLMALPAAVIMERMHVKHLVMAGMLFSSVFYFLQIFTTDEASLFTFGLLASMFLALFNISVAPFYLRNSSPKVRVHLFSLNSSMSMMAHLGGYLIGGFLPKLFSLVQPSWSMLEIYRTSIVLALGVVLLSNLLFMRIQKVPIPRATTSFLHGLREKDWMVLGKLILPKLCFAGGAGLIIPFMNIYLKEKFELSTQMIGLAYALLQFFIFVGIFIAPSIIRRTSNLKFILITTALSIPFMVLMGVTGNVGVVLSCFFMRGMLMNMAAPISSMIEMERVKEGDCVFASAIILFAYNLVYTFSTRVGGALIEEFSFGPTFYISAGFYALATVLYFRFFKSFDASEVRTKPLEVEEAA
jgi:MFS family permease